MTNSVTGRPPAVQQVFQQFLQAHGIADMHGVDLLRHVNIIANTYEAIASEQMRATRLTEPRWRILLRLWVAKQLGLPSVQPTQLSKAQNVSKNTISAHLRSLEEQGLIERELDPDDRRQFRIRLSESGLVVVEETTPGHVQFLNGLVADLSVEEVEQLQHLLQRLHHSLLKYGRMATE